MMDNATAKQFTKLGRTIFGVGMNYRLALNSLKYLVPGWYYRSDLRILINLTSTRTVLHVQVSTFHTEKPMIYCVHSTRRGLSVIPLPLLFHNRMSWIRNPDQTMTAEQTPEEPIIFQKAITSYVEEGNKIKVH